MKKTYTKRQIREAIAYWERRLRKMNETHKTMPMRRLQSAVAGDIMFGYGLPRGIIRDVVEEQVKETDTKTLGNWIEKGFVDPDIGDGYLDEETEKQIGRIIEQFVQKGHKINFIAVAERDIQLPPDDEPEEQMDVLDREIESAQHENPAFRDAAEIYLVHKADGSPCLISLWACDQIPRINGRH